MKPSNVNVPLVSGTSDPLPSKPELGEIVYDKFAGWIMQYNGSRWEIMGEYQMLLDAVKDIERRQKTKSW